MADHTPGPPDAITSAGFAALDKAASAYEEVLYAFARLRALDEKSAVVDAKHVWEVVDVQCRERAQLLADFERLKASHARLLAAAEAVVEDASACESATLVTVRETLIQELAAAIAEAKGTP